MRWRGCSRTCQFYDAEVGLPSGQFQLRLAAPWRRSASYSDMGPRGIQLGPSQRDDFTPSFRAEIEAATSTSPRAPSPSSLNHSDPR